MGNRMAESRKKKYREKKVGDADVPAVAQCFVAMFFGKPVIFRRHVLIVAS